MHHSILSASVLCLAMLAAPAWSAGNDELWEITTTMKMSGMAMPGAKSKSCIAKGGSYNPDSEQKDKRCKVSDYKVSGNTVSWKMQCTGKDAMSGTGEMTKTADAMKGVFKMSTSGMEMIQTMDGKRIGTCDAVAQRKAADEAVAEIQATSDANVRRGCDDAVRGAVESGGYGEIDSRFQGKGPCVSSKPKMCEQLRGRAGTYAGFASYFNNREMAKTTNRTTGWALAECGINLEQQRPALCQRALADRNYRFVGGFCPTEAAELNAKQCAGFGRDYTADLARPNAAMCRALRSQAANYRDADTQANAEADRAKAAESAKEAERNSAKTESSMNKLKKVFGF